MVVTRQNIIDYLETKVKENEGERKLCYGVNCARPNWFEPKFDTLAKPIVIFGFSKEEILLKLINYVFSNYKNSKSNKPHDIIGLIEEDDDFTDMEQIQLIVDSIMDNIGLSDDPGFLACDITLTEMTML